MSLRLCYRLTLPAATDIDEVRAKLGALREFSETLGFDDVLGPAEYTMDDFADPSNEKEIVCIIASTLCGDSPDFYSLPSGDPCVLAFLVVPGKECEPAIFGFVAPGSRNTELSEDDDLHPGEWFWSGCCGTTYASRVSNDHLIKCHLGLVRVLEHASKLGIGVEVEDETGYWKHRSTERLLKLVGDFDGMLDRMADEDYRRWRERHQADGVVDEIDRVVEGRHD